ncbi:MAG: VCBS repeat-containing protein [Bacteroidetes bacterium]|nr:VCBS repeat-containing protein [Bacteroidota bacterium]
MKKEYILVVTFILVTQIAFSQVPQIKWWYDVFDSSFGMSAAGDIDKDGKLEIVFGCYRNDSCVYALNAENGTLLWKYNTHPTGFEGCNDVAVLLYDVDKDDTLEVIVPSSCNAKTFCFRGKTGAIQWQTPTAGSDSPPTIADIDKDGRLEILHGGFDGHVLAIHADDGSVDWSKTVDNNSWVQTAPTVVDVDGNGQLDFIAGTWAFSPDTSRINAYRGDNQNLIWSKPVSDYIYHGSAVADIDKDGKPELVFGDYNGKLYALNAEDGSQLWTYQASVYIGAPATIADVNHDGNCDILYCDAYGVGALSKTGSPMWYYTIPDFGTAFRGVAVADIDGDNMLDVVFGTSKGRVIVLKGANGSVIWSLDLAAHIGKEFDINHAPLIADFDQDGKIDVFVVGGKTEYPNFQNNYGRAYLISAGNGLGPDWLMFQHDILRKSSMCDAPLEIDDIDQNINTVSFDIFPNPAQQRLTITSKQPGSIILYDVTGKRVQQYSKKAGSQQIDISNLSDGLYIINFISEHGVVTKKLVKE